MRRRTFIAAIAGSVAAWPTATRAQSRSRAHVGWLAPGACEPDWTYFRQSMAELGWIEGKTIDYAYRSAGSDLSRIDALAAELAGLKVDVLVAYFTPAINAARKATSTIPIVFTGGAIDAGIVGDLAHPTGNITGVGRGGASLAGKEVQLIRDVLPAARRIVAFCNAPDPFSIPFRRQLEKAARAQRLELEAVMIHAPSELQPAFEKVAADPPDAVIVQPSLSIKEAALMALALRLPAVSPAPAFAALGGLFANHADEADVERTVASYTSRILKGARIADLPIQEASRFKLVINQKTARTLGLTLPPVVLAQADQVIE
jgi:putative tryptophan/tyrosine transport system substrate-binding protein